MVESPDPLTYHADVGVPGRQFSDSIAFAGKAQDARAISDKSKVKNASSTMDVRLTARIVTHTPAHPVGATASPVLFSHRFSCVVRLSNWSTEEGNYEKEQFLGEVK